MFLFNVGFIRVLVWLLFVFVWVRFEGYLGFYAGFICVIYGSDVGSDWCFIIVLCVFSLASMFGSELGFIGGSCVFYVEFYVVSMWVLCGVSFGVYLGFIQLSFVVDLGSFWLYYVCLWFLFWVYVGFM